MDQPGGVTEPALIAEAGGWLAEHQRAACSGETPMRTYQGVLFDEIVLPQSAMDSPDPAQAVVAANAFARAMREHAHLIDGEFAPEASWNFYVNDWAELMRAGGQARYFARRGNDALAQRCCAAGLKSMLADPHLALFELMTRLQRADAKAAQRIARAAGYRTAVLAARDIDRRFAALEEGEPLAPRQKMWLRSLRKLKVAPDAEMGQHMQRIVAANQLHSARRAEFARLRSEAQQNDPMFASLRELCTMAGLSLADAARVGACAVRAVWPEGPERDGYSARVDTDRGPRVALFYVHGNIFKRRLVVLLEEGVPLPLSSLSLTRAQYDAVLTG